MNIGIIPARLDSKRFPKKILAPLNGKPMVANTVERSLMAKKLDRVILAIDSRETKDALKGYGFEMVMTSKEHSSGTDRIAEVARDIKDANIIINIQGDEPLIDPNHIDKVIKWHNKNRSFDIVIPSLKSKDIDTKHIVKIVKNKKKILYFSRAKVPFPFKKKNYFFNKHLSIISFKPNVLKKFRSLPESTLEKIEGIEMMRALENEMKLGTFELKGNSFSVDTSDDYFKAREYMTKDRWRKRY